MTEQELSEIEARANGMWVGPWDLAFIGNDEFNVMQGEPGWICGNGYGGAP